MNPQKPRLTSLNTLLSRDRGQSFVAQTGWKELESLNENLQNQSKVLRVAPHIRENGERASHPARQDLEKENVRHTGLFVAILSTIQAIILHLEILK